MTPTTPTPPWTRGDRRPILSIPTGGGPGLPRRRTRRRELRPPRITSSLPTRGCDASRSWRRADFPLPLCTSIALLAPRTSPPSATPSSYATISCPPWPTPRPRRLNLSERTLLFDNARDDRNEGQLS